MRKLLTILFLFFPLLSIGKTIPNTPPAFMIKLYFEPEKMNTYSYQITLPQNESLSYYKGSDLPKWQMTNEITMKSSFKPGELINIRVHQQNNKNLAKADLQINDEGNARIIWKGTITLQEHQQLMVQPEFDNSKYYLTHINTQKETGTAWIEMEDKK